jgi:DNA-binding HxlR family transcriptional regulator
MGAFQFATHTSLSRLQNATQSPKVTFMPARKNLDYLDCSVANALDIIGDRWSLLILRDAFLGVRRFDDWQKDLGIARNILAQRLDRLVQAEILEPRRYQESPARDEYVLTAKGKDLLDVLLTLWRWGDRWTPPPPKVHRDLVHLDCGHVTHAVPSCAHCGEELKRSNLRIEPGLAVVAERLAAST